MRINVYIYVHVYGFTSSNFVTNLSFTQFSGPKREKNGEKKAVNGDTEERGRGAGGRERRIC